MYYKRISTFYNFAEFTCLLSFYYACSFLA